MIIPERVSGAAFGTAVDGNPRTDAAARRAVSDSLGIPSEWAWVHQVHGADVVEASAPGNIGQGDAIITMNRGIPVAVSVADCLPVVLVARGAVGVAHVGWRGAVAGVVQATAAAMAAAGHPTERVVIGPGIQACCFEVGPEVAEHFPGHPATTTWDTASVDLAAVVADAVDDAEVIDVASCTNHDERFNSHRRNGTKLRQFGVAWLAPA